MDRNKLREFRHNTYNRLRSQGMGRRAAAKQAGVSSHRKTAIAEIRQDVANAKRENDLTALNDAKARLGALRQLRYEL